MKVKEVLSAVERGLVTPESEIKIRAFDSTFVEEKKVSHAHMGFQDGGIVFLLAAEDPEPLEKP